MKTTRTLLTLAAGVSLFGLGSASAYTVVTGTVNEFTSPDELLLNPVTAVVAVDVFGNADRPVNGVTFFTDRNGLGSGVTAEGVVSNGGATVTTTSTNTIDNWAGAPTFTGGTPGSAANLGEIMRDIRWSNNGVAPLTVDIAGLTPGALYNIQLLFNEGADRNRRWDIQIDGNLVVDDFTSEGNGVWSASNSFAYSGDFDPGGDGALNIVMRGQLGGDPPPGGADLNPILQGVVVHLLRPEIGIHCDTSANPEIPISNLLAFFDFDGQTDNQFGLAPDAALNGPATIAPGGSGYSGAGGDGSLDLGGVNNGAVATLPTGSHFDPAFNNNAMAVSYWQYNTQVGNTSAFWVHSPAAGAVQRGFQAHTPWGNGTVFFDQSGCCGQPNQRLTVGGPINLSTWQHFVFQRDAAGNMEIWIDGNIVAGPRPGAEALDAFNGGMTIGGEPPSNNSFGGRLDEMSVWASTLSPTEIAALAGGASTRSISGAVDFGATCPGIPLCKNFVIANTGSETLNLGAAVVPAGYSIVGTLPASIAPGEEVTVKVQFDAAGADGIYSGAVSFANDDEDEGDYTFQVTALLDGTAPQFTFVPEKTFVVAASGDISAVAEWDEPTAADDLDPDPAVTQTAGDPSGSSFPLGVTEITYEATNSAGKTTVETFKVVVCLHPDDVLPIATTEDTAPGGNGGTFSSFDGGYIAGPGYVVVEGDEASDIGLWRGNVNMLPLSPGGLLGLAGTSTPPGASGTIDGFDRYFVAKDGYAVFRARTAGGGEGHWGEPVGGPQAAIAVLGDPALGSTYTKFALPGQGLNKHGEYCYLARVARSGGVTKFTDWAIFDGSGAVKIQKGDAVWAVPGATYLDFEPQIALNKHDELVFSAAMRGTGVTNGVDNRALFSGLATSPGIVSRKGDAAVAGPGTISQFGCEAINKDGAVAFSVVLAGAGVTTGNNTALYTDLGGPVVQIVREGDPALGFTGGEAYESFGEVYICGGDDAAVWFKARVSPAVATENDAIYVWRPGTGLELVAKEGAVAPGTSGVWKNLPKLTSTHCCHAAFTGILQRGVGGVTRDDEHGLWFVRAGGTTPSLRIRGGDTFECPAPPIEVLRTRGAPEEPEEEVDTTKTVRRVDFAETKDDGIGGRSSALGAGNIVVMLSYQGGGKSGVFLLGLCDVEEPEVSLEP